MALTKIKADGLTADLIDETKLADNSIDSEHYNDGSIDNAHLADDAVGVAELSATGTASSSTFLRGDNSWVTPTDTNTQLAFANDANNRVVTGDGSGGLNGEANLTFDGNHLGIGVTPSGWPTNGDSVALQIGKGFAAFGRGSSDEDRGGIAVNYYTDGTDNKYIANGHSNRIYLNDGNIDFQYAASNSSGAGADITYSNSMRIDTNGKVGIGTTSPGGFKLKVEGGDSDEGLFIHTGNSSSQWLIRAEDNAGNQRLVVKASGEVTIPNQPSFSVKGSSTWHSVSSGQWGTFDLGTASHNVGSIYDTTNKRFTAPVAGVYQVNANMYSASADSNADTDEYCAMQLKLNGSNLSETWSIDHYFHRADQDNTRSGSWLIKMAVNDYIDLSFYASGRTWKYYGAHSSFSAHLLG